MTERAVNGITMFDPTLTVADLSRAIEVACLQHEGQNDKLGQPYIWHPLRVAANCALTGYGFDHQIAAVLHDVVEDTGYPARKVADEFGLTVAEAVRHLTRKKSDETYHEFILRVRRNDIATVVKWFDLTDNLARHYQLAAIDPELAKGLRRRYTSAVRTLRPRYEELLGGPALVVP